MANPTSAGQHDFPAGAGSMPLDNLTYDIITMIYEKSKGLEAHQKYAQDAQQDGEVADVFQSIRQRDEHAVQQLLELLQQRLSSRHSRQAA